MMADETRRGPEFWRELKRRKVFRVAAVYAVVAFLVWQVADLAFEPLGLPPWTMTLVIVLTLIGLPIALVLAWAFEVTPEGVRRTGEAEGAETASGGGRAWAWGILVLSFLLAGAGIWYATTGDDGERSADRTAGAEAAVGVAAADRDADGPPRIAVLPFDDIAPDPGKAFFAEGMHEEIISQLSKISALEVISRTSVMQYAATDKPVREISRELGGLNALLEGSVRRAADRVRITTQLIDARRDAHVWSETYERELSVEEIFEIQADIAEQIAAALEAQLTEGERQRIEAVPTSDLAAYDAYLKGESQSGRYVVTQDPAHLKRATESFREAIRRDSAFVEAYSGLARSYYGRYLFDEADTRWLDSASAYVDRARALDPNSTDALRVQGYIYGQRGSPEAAEQAYERVLELDPNADVAGWFSDHTFGQGNFVEALRWAHRAVRRDPRNPWLLFEMGTRFLPIGMLDAAQAWFRHSLEVDPDTYFSVQMLAWLYLARGEAERARQAVRSFRARHREHVEALGLAAQVALEMDSPGQARKYLQRMAEVRREARGEPSTSEPEQALLELGDQINFGLAEIRLGHRARGRELLSEAADSLRGELQGETPSAFRRVGLDVQLAGVLAVLGQKQEALRQLERWAEDKMGLLLPFLLKIRFPSLFEEIRSEPRFPALIQGIEARQERLREEVRQLDIDLYPPGPEPDTLDRFSQRP